MDPALCSNIPGLLLNPTRASVGGMQRRSYTFLLTLAVLTVLLQAATPWVLPREGAWLGVASAVLTSILVLALGLIVVFAAYAVGRRSLSHHDRLHAAFEQAREDYIRLFHTTPEGIFTADDQFALQTLNLSGARILGAIEPSSLIGKRFTSLCADPDAVRAVFERAALEPIPVQGSLLQLRVQRGDDAPRWIEVTCQARRGGAGELLGVEGIFRDVSDRVRAESKATERFEKLQSAYLELGRVNRHLALLEETCLLHSSVQETPDELLRAGLHACAVILQAEAGILIQLDAKNGGGKVRDQIGLPDIGKNRSVKIRPNVQGLLTHLPQDIPATQSVGATMKNLENTGLAWATVLPCLLHGEPVGVMELYRHEPHTETPDKRLLQAVASQIALVLAGTGSIAKNGKPC